MKLVNSKYIYEIESNYKVNDKVVFTDKCSQGGNGLIIAIVTYDNRTEYLVDYQIMTGGQGNYKVFETSHKTDIFPSDQIRPVLSRIIKKEG